MYLLWKILLACDRVRHEFLKGEGKVWKHYHCWYWLSTSESAVTNCFFSRHSLIMWRSIWPKLFPHMSQGFQKLSVNKYSAHKLRRGLRGVPWGGAHPASGYCKDGQQWWTLGFICIIPKSKWFAFEACQFTSSGRSFQNFSGGGPTTDLSYSLI